jgi:hypothetical protein
MFGFSTSIAKNYNESVEIESKMMKIYKKLYIEYEDLKRKDEGKTILKREITKKESNRLANLKKIVQFMNTYSELRKKVSEKVYKVVSDFDRNIGESVNVKNFKNVLGSITISGGRKRRSISKKKSDMKKTKKSTKSKKSKKSKKSTHKH